jgi:hypothetical protein
MERSDARNLKADAMHEIFKGPMMRVCWRRMKKKEDLEKGRRTTSVASAVSSEVVCVFNPQGGNPSHGRSLGLCDGSRTAA